MDQISSLTKRGDDAVRALKPGTGLENFDADAALLHVLLSRLEQQEEDTRSRQKILSPSFQQQQNNTANMTSSFLSLASPPAAPTRNTAAVGNISPTTANLLPLRSIVEEHDDKESSSNNNHANNDFLESSSAKQHSAVSSNLIRLLNSQHQQQGDRVDSTAFYHTQSLGSAPPSHLKSAILAENLSAYPIDVRRQAGRLRSEYDIGRATLLRMIKVVADLLNKYQQASSLNKEIEKELLELKENHGEISKELRRMKLAKKYLGADSTHAVAHNNNNNNNNEKKLTAKTNQNNSNEEFEEAWKLESEASSKEVDEHVRSSVEHFKTLVLLHKHSKTLASIVCPDAPIAAAEEAEAQMISAHIEEESRLAKILAEKLKNHTSLINSNANPLLTINSNNNNTNSKLAGRVGGASSTSFLTVPVNNNNNNFTSIGKSGSLLLQQRTASGKLVRRNSAGSVGFASSSHLDGSAAGSTIEGDEEHREECDEEEASAKGESGFVSVSRTSVNTSMNEKMDDVGITINNHNTISNKGTNNNNNDQQQQHQRSKTPLSVFAESNTSVTTLDDGEGNANHNNNNNSSSVPLAMINILESTANSLTDVDFHPQNGNRQQQNLGNNNYVNDDGTIIPFSQIESKFRKQEKVESKLVRKYSANNNKNNNNQVSSLESKHPNLRRHTRKELLNIIRSIDSKNETAVELKNARRENSAETDNSRTGDLGILNQHQPPQRKKMSDVLKSVDTFLIEWGPKNTNNTNGGKNNNNNNKGDDYFDGDGGNNNNFDDDAKILISFRRCRGGVAEYKKYSGVDLRRRINYSQQFAIAACRSEHHTMQVDNFDERIENITVLRRTHPHHQQLLPPVQKNAAGSKNSGSNEDGNVNDSNHNNTTSIISSPKTTMQTNKSSSGTTVPNRRGFQLLNPEDYASLSREDQEDYRIQLEHNKNVALRTARGERLRVLVKCRPEDRRVISLATMLVETLSQNRSPFVIIRSIVPDETLLSRATMRSHGLGPIWQVGGEATFCVASCPLPLLQTVAPTSLTSNAQSVVASNALVRASVSTFQLPTTTDPGEAANTPGIISFLASFVVPKEVTAKYETSAAKAEASRRYLLRENYMRCYASSALPGTLTSALIGPYVDPSRPFFVTSNESGGEYVEIFFARAVVYPTGYSFASCHVSGAAAFPRFWRLEGSADSGVTWTLLKRHVDDKTLHNCCPRAAWAIDPPSATPTASSSDGSSPTTAATKSNPGNNHQSQVFSRFRISIEGPNSSGTWHINASCIEIYGRVLTLQSAASSLVAQERVPFLTTPAVVATVSSEGKGSNNNKVSFTSTSSPSKDSTLFQHKPSTTFTNSYAGLGAPPVAFVAQVGKKEKTAGGKKASPVRKR